MIGFQKPNFSIFFCHSILRNFHRKWSNIFSNQIVWRIVLHQHCFASFDKIKKDILFICQRFHCIISTDTSHNDIKISQFFGRNFIRIQYCYFVTHLHQTIRNIIASSHNVSNSFIIRFQIHSDEFGFRRF